MTSPGSLLGQDAQHQLPVVFQSEIAAQRCDPKETLLLVARAASTVRTMQRDMDFVNTCTRELLARTKEERSQLTAELRDLRLQVEEWQWRARACESDLRRIETIAQSESKRRSEAEAAAFEATRRAETAESQREEFQSILVGISKRFPLLAHLVELELESRTAG